MGERFAFVTEEEINLLVDKAVPENNIRSKRFDGKLFVNEMFKYSSSLRHFLLVWWLCSTVLELKMWQNWKTWKTKSFAHLI